MADEVPVSIWLLFWSIFLIVLLVLPTYVGGLYLRLAVGTFNASTRSESPVLMPDRGTAMSIIFLATLFNLLVTWSYLESFGLETEVPPTNREYFEEEQQFKSKNEVKDGPLLVDKAILLLRTLLYGLAILILSRILLDTTPWRAFVVTGNYFLINVALLALLALLLKIELFLPAPR